MLTKTANELIGKNARILESGKIGTIDSIILDGYGGTVSVIIPVTMMKDVPLDAIEYCTCGEGGGCYLCAETPPSINNVNIIREQTPEPEPQTFIEAAKWLRVHLQAYTDTIVRLEREQAIEIIKQQGDEHERESKLLGGIPLKAALIKAEECKALAESIRTAGTWANLL